MPKLKELKSPKGSVLDKIEEEAFLIPDYSDEEKTYISNLQKRLTAAGIARGQSFEEFDGMTYSDYWRTNERGANTYIEAVKNRGETLFQSGTLRTKMMAFLSSFQGLNLKADISAFNEKEILLNTLGNGIEDILEKTQELENDEEQRMLRQYEILKQGTVFVEEIWYEEWETIKELKKGFYGQISGVSWSSKKVKTKGSPRRSILPGPSVYLGDLTKYFIDDQPYIFTVQVKNWSEAEQIYGNWERWKYVSKTKRSFAGLSDQQMIVNAWRFVAELQKNQVEIVKYQDKPNNEFQIIINGVLMLPLGFPLSSISSGGGYSIVQQNLEPIRENFSYGKSFIFKNKNLVAILDMMMKLSVLKTQKSFLPPRLNLSDRIISRDVFMPGVISRGIMPGDVPPIDATEVQGVTAGEFRFIQEVKTFINENTVSPTFTGAKEAGGKVTATQIIELQRQSRIMMGLMVLAASLLEKKLSTKRLMIILEKWFDPIDNIVDKSRNILRNRYRITSRRMTISNEGEGFRMVIPSEEIPTSEEIRTSEETMKTEIGSPVRMIFLNPKEIKHARLTWVINVVPKEKKSSELSKILFGAMLQDAINLGLRLNLDYIEERFAQVWEEDSAKMFRRESIEEQSPLQPGMKGLPPKRGMPNVSAPNIKLPGQGASLPAPQVLR